MFLENDIYALRHCKDAPLEVTTITKYNDCLMNLRKVEDEKKHTNRRIDKANKLSTTYV